MKSQLVTAFFFAIALMASMPAIARKPLYTVWVEGYPGTVVTIMDKNRTVLIEKAQAIEAVHGFCETPNKDKYPRETCAPIVIFSSRKLQPDTEYQIVCTTRRGMGETTAKKFSTKDQLSISVDCPGYKVSK